MDSSAPILIDPPPAPEFASPAAARPRGEVHGADLFCGAGGTSTAAHEALASLGCRLKLVAVNHWRIAVDTHSVNHPGDLHFCQDLATLRPLVAVPEGRLDILIASPTCTYHSRARGGRPVSDQQRMDPWHILPWLTELHVTRLFVENVPEFVKWGPVDPATGKPIREREGEYFHAWIRALNAVGFTSIEHRIINFADHGDPTTRERFILKGRSDGKPIRWAEPAYAKDGRHGRRRWRAAREIIDWNRRGRCVFGRPVPLKPNTIRRIMVGAARYFGPLADAYVDALEVELRRSIARWGDKTKTRAGRTRWQTAGSDGAAVVELRGTGAARSVHEPVPALTGGGTHVGVAVAEARPIVGAHRTNNAPWPVDLPIRTIVTSGNIYLAEPQAVPFTLGQHGGSVARPVDDPLMTIAGGGAISLTQAALIHLKGRSDAASVDSPVPTIATRGQIGVAESFVFPVNQGHGRTRGIRGTDEPLPTIVTRESLGTAHAMISPYYGSGSGLACKPVDAPLDTVTARSRFGLAQSILVQVDQAGGRGWNTRPTDLPVPTMVTKQNVAVAVPEAEPFLAVYNGEKDGQPRAARGVDEPAPTLTGEPRLALCEPATAALDAATADELRHLADARRLAVVDGVLCVLTLPYRMLANDELAGAMSFPKGYRFTGKPAEVTKQIGNAVPRLGARAEIRALFEE